MRWNEVNLDQAQWRIPETKNGDPLLIPLSRQAVDILRARKAEASSVWVFPNESSKDGRFKDPKRAWQRLIRRTELYQLLELLTPKKGWDTEYINRAKQEAEANLTKALKGYHQEAARLKLDTSALGLPGIRIHDLRRSLGSWQAVTGANQYVIGKSLGHKSQQATAIYARLNLDPVRDSVERATEAMFQAGGYDRK